LYCWDVATCRQRFHVRAGRFSTHDLCFSADGKRIASGGGEKTIRIWDAQRGTELLSLKGHVDQVHSVAFSHDGKRLVSADSKNRIRIWSTLDAPNPAQADLNHTQGLTRLEPHR
jgi:WD40 repeat protein